MAAAAWARRRRRQDPGTIWWSRKHHRHDWPDRQGSHMPLVNPVVWTDHGRLSWTRRLRSSTRRRTRLWDRCRLARSVAHVHPVARRQAGGIRPMWARARSPCWTWRGARRRGVTLAPVRSAAHRDLERRRQVGSSPRPTALELAGIDTGDQHDGIDDAVATVYCGRQAAPTKDGRYLLLAIPKTNQVAVIDPGTTRGADHRRSGHAAGDAGESAGRTDGVRLLQHQCAGGGDADYGDVEGAAPRSPRGPGADGAGGEVKRPTYERLLRCDHR